VNSKVILKTGKKRMQTWQIGVVSYIILAVHILGCFQMPADIPKELHGKYSTTHPDYEDQFFELSTGLIMLGFAGSKLKYYSVKKVEKEMIDHRMLYTILCANEDEGEEFNFAFFADPAANGKGTIHFKNKTQVSWEKQETVIDSADHQYI
jgi:hypothetical protein